MIPPIHSTLQVQNEEIKFEQSTTFLGLSFNEHLCWKNQITNLNKHVRKNLAIVSKFKNQLNSSTLVQIFQSIVLGKIRYCISSWCYGNKTLRDQLQRSCNNFLRMIFGLKWRDSVKPIMKKFKIPTIQSMLINELATLMHKYYSNSIPIALRDLFTRNTLNVRTRSGSVTSRNAFRLQTSKQALSYRGTKTWEVIPNSIKYLVVPRSGQSDQAISRTLRPLKEFKRLLNEYLQSNPEVFEQI